MRRHRTMLQTIRRVACASLVTAMVAATTANVALAAELNPAHVLLDAKWLLHIDQEALSGVKVVEELRAMYPRITSDIREWFKNRYGIDPREDLRSLTMFSRDYQVHTGTVLLQAEYDKMKIRSTLQKYDNFKKTEWKGHTLYTITLAKHHDHTKHAGHHALKHGAESYGENGRSATADGHDKSGGKQMTVYLGDELIVLASSVPNAKSVLRLLEGDAASLEGTSSPLIAEAPAGAVIYGAAIELGRLDQYDMLLPLLQQQEKCVYAFGQRDGKLFETLTLTGQSEEVARKTTEVLEGVIAYEQLWAAGSESLAELVKEVRLSRDGTETTASWEGESELVTKAFGDLKARVDQWMRMAISLKAKESSLKAKGASTPPSPAARPQAAASDDEAAEQAGPQLGVIVAPTPGGSLLVLRVRPGSPADQAGIRHGDYLLSVAVSLGSTAKMCRHPSRLRNTSVGLNQARK